MTELLTGLSLVAAAGGAVTAGVVYGTRFIDEKLRYRDVELSEDKPIVRPSHPSGGFWAKG
jgi:hypothetical protein